MFKEKVFFCLLILFLPVLVFSAEDLNHKVNAQAKFQNDNKARIFVSRLDSDTWEMRVKDTFSKLGFTYRKDKEMKIGSFRRLRFDRNNQVIDVCLFALENRGTRVVVTHYLASEAVLDTKDGTSYISKLPIELPNYKLGNKLNIGTSDLSTGTDKEAYSDFQMPLPAQSELLNKEVPPSMVGKGGIGKMYYIKDNPDDIENFYRTSLKRQGFKEAKDKNFKLMKIKRVRFERDDMALELYLTPTEGEGCKIIIVKYADRNGTSRIEGDPLGSTGFPKSDNVGGSDLKDIPRPSGSVRLSGGTRDNMNDFSYTLSMSVSEARDFYLKQMSSAGWTLVNESNIKQFAEDYAKGHHGKQIIPSVLIGSSLDLGDIIKESIVLDFSSNSATANLMIYPNFINPAAGSIVDITYTVVQNRGE